MPEEIAAMICASCGAPVQVKAENCAYCGNLLLYLTAFEVEPAGEKRDQGKFFHSLSALYKGAIYTGTASCILIYTVGFSFLSETLLILISPLWFLMLHFGLSGLYTEIAVRAILDKKAGTFAEGLLVAAKQASPLQAMAAYITFMPMFFIFKMKGVTSPLKQAALTTLIWAGLLYLFFVAVFPSL